MTSSVQVERDTAQTVQVEPVGAKQGVIEFLKFPFRLYQGDANWVPPFIEERRDFLDPKKNPFFQHARSQLFIARRAGQIVGTIAAAIDDNHNAAHNEQVGAFGFFETIDDQQVAQALLDAARDWVRAQGMTIIRGPMSFGTNHELGLLVEGFHQPPMVMMTYNPRYYEPLIEQAGYTKAMDLYAYYGDLDVDLPNAPKKIYTAAERAMHKEGIRVRKASKRDFVNEVRRIKEIYNQILERNWGFVPLTEAEFDHLAKGLKPIVDENLIFIAEKEDGTPIGASIALPDLHQALQWCGGGRMFPLGVLKFLWHKRKINRCRLMILGVIEEYRGKGIDAVFYVRTLLSAKERGYKEIEGSWVLESNTMMNRILERMGGHRYKTYRIYERAV